MKKESQSSSSELGINKHNHENDDINSQSQDDVEGDASSSSSSINNDDDNNDNNDDNNDNNNAEDNYDDDDGDVGYELLSPSTSATTTIAANNNNHNHLHVLQQQQQQQGQHRDHLILCAAPNPLRLVTATSTSTSQDQHVLIAKKEEEETEKLALPASCAIQKLLEEVLATEVEESLIVRLHRIQQLQRWVQRSIAFKQPQDAQRLQYDLLTEPVLPEEEQRAMSFEKKFMKLLGLIEGRVRRLDYDSSLEEALLLSNLITKVEEIKARHGY